MNALDRNSDDEKVRAFIKEFCRFASDCVDEKLDEAYEEDYQAFLKKTLEYYELIDNEFEIMKARYIEQMKKEQEYVSTNDNSSDSCVGHNSSSKQ